MQGRSSSSKFAAQRHGAGSNTVTKKDPPQLVGVGMLSNLFFCARASEVYTWDPSPAPETGWSSAAMHCFAPRARPEQMETTSS